MTFVKKAKKETEEKVGTVVELDNAKFAKKGGSEKPTPKKEKEKKAVREVASKEDTRKITLVEKNNPKREGSEGYKRYALYKTGMKVVDFVAAGGTTADIRHDTAKGFIKVA